MKLDQGKDSITIEQKDLEPIFSKDDTGTFFYSYSPEESPRFRQDLSKVVKLTTDS